MKTKMKSMFAVAVVALSFQSVMAQTQNEQYLGSEPIDINGYMKEEAPVTDQELEQVRNDISQAKNMTKLNKQKAKGYNKLVKETEKLSEASEKLIEERKDAQQEIQHYQTKVDCLMGRTSGEECAEFLKEKKADEVKLKQAATVTPVTQTEVVTTKTEQTVKVLPFIGLTSFDGEREDLEAELSTGIRDRKSVV